jgi:hypothetical protein
MPEPRVSSIEALSMTAERKVFEAISQQLQHRSSKQRMPNAIEQEGVEPTAHAYRCDADFRTSAQDDH